MTTKFIKQIIVLTLLFVNEALFAQQPVFVKDSLDEYVENEMKGWKVPALAVAIVKDGKVVHLKGYGTKSVNSKEAVDENTLFMIGSNTKLFTATALATAEQDKKLSLEDKAKKWLPYFKLKDTLASNAINIKDLLSHRIGFETFQGDFTYWCSKLSREEVVKKMALVNPVYDFRTTWGYTNAAFVASGEILYKATGEKWEDYIRKNILIPLEMNNTLMLAEEIKNAKNTALPHTVINNKLTQINFPMLDNLAPAGSISSSAKDMANWLLAQLENGKFEEKQIIPENAILTTREPQSILYVYSPNIYLYGLGIEISNRANKIVYGHTGGVDGFTSFVSFVPEEKLGIVVLTNTDQNTLYYSLGTQILGSYLDIPYKNYSQQSLAYYQKYSSEQQTITDSLRAIVAKKNKPILMLEKFTGNYGNELYGDISIKLENQKLIIHFSNHPNLTATLEYLTDNKFLCDYSISTYGNAIETPFVIENDEVKEFTLKVADFIENTPYIFTKK